MILNLLIGSVIVMAYVAMGRLWLRAEQRANRERAQKEGLLNAASRREARRQEVETAVRELREGREDVVVTLRDAWSLFVRAQDGGAVESLATELPSAPAEVLARQLVKRLGEPRCARDSLPPSSATPMPWQHAQAPKSGRQYVGRLREPHAPELRP